MFYKFYMHFLVIVQRFEHFYVIALYKLKYYYYYYALVMSRVDYGNALLFGLPEMQLHTLQMIQNSAARLVTGTHGRDHITPVLFKLHWLPVRYRIEFKLLVLVYQAVHHLGPAYLTSLVTPLCTHSLTEIRGSPFFDNTAIQLRAVLTYPTLSPS